MAERFLFAAAFLCTALTGCGPRHLSALGNPGDLCTERTACVEGTGCRITEAGYRCVGPDGRMPESSSGFSPDGDDEGEGAAGPAVESGGGELEEPDPEGSPRGPR